MDLKGIIMTIQTKSWARDRSILESQFGIYLPNVLDYTNNARAGDSIITPITPANNAIPEQFTTYIDPNIIEVLTAFCKAVSIYGEAKKSDWLHDAIIFTVVEPAGEIAAYGDSNHAGYSVMNTAFPQRQQFLVQTFAEWDDRVEGCVALANIDISSRKRIASALLLNHWQNQSYFFGVANLQNHGALNDPALLLAITPKTKTSGGTAWEKATANEIYHDIQKLYRQLQAQTKGIINLDNAVNMDSPLKLVVSNQVQPHLLKTNEHEVGVVDLLKKNFPNLTQVSAPQLSLEGGGLIQLFIENYQGIDTITCAFSEKLLSHGIVCKTSSMKENLTQGSWGVIIARLVLVA